MQEFKKPKTKDFNSPRNKPTIVIDYWSKKVEGYFHLRNPDTFNISEKSTTHDVTNVMNTMVNHINSMEQGMIGIQDNFIELEKDMVKKSVSIDQLIRENIPTKQNPHQLPHYEQ